MSRILHVLSQRPHLTGSGVTIDALVRHAAAGGHEQCVVAGIGSKDPIPAVGGLSQKVVHARRFVDPVPGMSDVMPYESTVFSSMTPSDIDAYERGWRTHVEAVLDHFTPDIVHTHHAWILSAVVAELVRERGLDARVVLHAHATGLRQMRLCRPEIGARVRRGLTHVDAFVVLHEDHRRAVIDLGVDAPRVHVVGAGFRADVFGLRGAERNPRRIVYAGKLSAAKGVEPLLDAVGHLDDVELHVAGDGAGPEAERIKTRLAASPQCTWHGMLGPDALAQLLSTAGVFVLPSFYEGLPLVIVEALACGCRVVASKLDGIESAIEPYVSDRIDLVPLPRLEGIDRPVADDLPGFVTALADRIDAATRAPVDHRPLDLSRFTWAAVAERVEAVWFDA